MDARTAYLQSGKAQEKDRELAQQHLDSTYSEVIHQIDKASKSCLTSVNWSINAKPLFHNQKYGCKFLEDLVTDRLRKDGYFVSQLECYSGNVYYISWHKSIVTGLWEQLKCLTKSFFS